MTGRRAVFIAAVCGAFVFMAITLLVYRDSIEHAMRAMYA
jgi:hypothetical protein